MSNQKVYELTEKLYQMGEQIERLRSDRETLRVNAAGWKKMHSSAARTVRRLQAENARLRAELENLTSAFVVEKTGSGIKVSLGENRSLIIALENAKAALAGGESGGEAPNDGEECHWSIKTCDCE